MIRKLADTVLKRFANIYISFNPFKIIEFKELFREINFSKREKILDLGCGHGIQTIFLGKRSGTTIGIDPGPINISKANERLVFHNRRKNIHFRQVVIERAEFPDSFFDKVVSICVIEHIPNYEEVIGEISRVLKKGGEFIFSVDSLESIHNKEIKDRHRREHKVVKFFQNEEIKNLLEEKGFNEIIVYSIFRSNFAQRLFEEGLRSNFRFGVFRAFRNYIKLRKEERKTSNKEGIFLIAKCKKL